MKTAIAIRHVHFEDLGSLGRVLWRQGYQVEYRDAGIDSLDHHDLDLADLLVILGGPIGAYEEEAYPFISDEILEVDRRLQREKPTLGICLGAQIMARALGKRVYPAGVKELGWAPVELTSAGLASPLAAIGETPVLHWHGDTFDMPAEGNLLASTDRVKNQAFSIGDYGLALQFHMEVEPKPLERWYIGHTSEIAAEGIAVPTLRAQAATHGPALTAAADKIFEDWITALPAKAGD